MIVSDLYTLKPTTLGIGHLMLVDGRSLIAVLNEYPGIRLPVGQRVSIQQLITAIEGANLTDEQHQAIAALDIDEDNQMDSGNVDLSALSAPDVHSKSQRFVVVVATVALFFITVAYTGMWGWLTFVEHTKPSLNPMLVLSVCWTMVIWKSQGIITRERKDMLSAIFGDAPTQKGFWGMAEKVAGAMKK